MLINADFTSRATVAPNEYQWVDSPQAGVERVMLDRVGEEKARATSIVRYAPESYFPRHEHPGGEEIFVISGTFSDEDGDYPAGWYVRNPPGSSHQPSSVGGATIFVKLWQMTSNDHRKVRVDTRDPANWQRRNGCEVCPLYQGEGEQVCLRRLAPDEVLFADPVDSAELLVLTGEVVVAGKSYPRGGWIRLPEGAYPDITAGSRGTTVYVKTGHLVDMAPER